MKKKANKILTSIAVLSLLTACGKDDKSSSGSGSNDGAREEQREEPAALDGSHIQGHYQAKFVTLNPHVNGTIPGSANFYRKDEKIYAYVRLFAGKVKAWHMQHVYTGGRCPTMKDDLNNDGFIDIVEAEKVLGKILIPLDSDISSQTSGRRFFPLADLSGYYHYERITNFNRFLADLQKEDSDPEDDLVKLGPDTPLRIAGKTVLIQGVDETVDLPETVATKDRRRAFQTLPIVCGVFKKMEEMPGTPYVVDGPVPGPIADVVEGQDRPAEEPIPDTTGGGAGGTSGGGSNESDDGDGPVSDGEGRTSGGSTGRPDDYGSDDDDDDNRRPRTTTGGTSGGRTPGSSTGSSTTGGTTGETPEPETTGSGSGSTTTGGSDSGSTTTTTSSSSTTGGTFGF